MTIISVFNIFYTFLVKYFLGPVGFFADLTGLQNCTQCGAGKFASQAGSTRCTNCVAGMYSDDENVSSCAIVCTLCLSSKYLLYADASHMQLFLFMLIVLFCFVLFFCFFLDRW